MHSADASEMGEDPHMAYLSEVAALAMAAAVRLTSHKGKPSDAIEEATSCMNMYEVQNTLLHSDELLLYFALSM